MLTSAVAAGGRSSRAWPRSRMAAQAGARSRCSKAPRTAAKAARSGGSGDAAAASSSSWSLRCVVFVRVVLVWVVFVRIALERANLRERVELFDERPLRRRRQCQRAAPRFRVDLDATRARRRADPWIATLDAGEPAARQTLH